MRIILYARVSTEDQNVDQQVEYMKKWFARNGYYIIKTIKDKESGRLPLTKRKRFLKALKQAQEEQIPMGIYNLDRLTRNWDDVTLIEKHFRDNWEHCKLISTSDNIDLSNSTGRFTFRVIMATSCLMPEKMREQQKIGIARAKKEGKYKGRKVGTKNKAFYTRKRK